MHEASFKEDFNCAIAYTRHLNNRSKLELKDNNKAHIHNTNRRKFM